MLEKKLLINDNILKFKEDIERLSKQRVSNCYQCGKCTAGCPVAFAMDYPPNQVIRMIQLGLRDEVMSSHAPWFCASCETCTTRCPREIDLARIMDTIRIIMQSQNHKLPEKDIPLLNSIFLSSLKFTGRVYEVGLLGAYNLLSMHLFKDVLLGIKMLGKGKLSLFPHISENLKGLFDTIQKMEKKNV